MSATGLYGFNKNPDVQKEHPPTRWLAGVNHNLVVVVLPVRAG